MPKKELWKPTKEWCLGTIKELEKLAHKGDAQTKRNCKARINEINSYIKEMGK